MDYRRPQQTSDSYSAWDIAHSLMCDIEYFLQETNSKHIELPKHALDMMLKHMHRELSDIRDLTEEKHDEG